MLASVTTITCQDAAAASPENNATAAAVDPLEVLTALFGPSESRLAVGGTEIFNWRSKWAMDGIDIRVLAKVRVDAERSRNAAEVSWLHTGLAQICFGRILIFCAVSESKGRTVRDAFLLACRSSCSGVRSIALPAES